jgi:periplasmic copper chaperone A
MMKLKSWALATTAFLLATPAFAHVTLEGKQAAVGSAYKAVFVVPHGCSGSATVKLRVQIPPGVIVTDAKPTSGWQLSTVTGKYPGEYDFQGKKVAEGITEVDWSGGKLPDKTRETFAVEAFLTGGLKPNTTLYFPVVQECEQGVNRWIEIPADADHVHDKKWPAPGVKLLPAP